MNRIETALQALQEKEEKAFITYITAGLPDYDKTKAIIKAQEAAGTDIIELGIPFSDPVADGPVIQAASYEAILGGANLEKTFTCMKEMRDDGVQIPIVCSDLGFNVKIFLHLFKYLHIFFCHCLIIMETYRCL